MPRDLPRSLFSLLQLNLTTLTLSPSSWDICSRWGSITLHGPHLPAPGIIVILYIALLYFRDFGVDSLFPEASFCGILPVGRECSEEMPPQQPHLAWPTPAGTRPSKVEILCVDSPVNHGRPL